MEYLNDMALFVEVVKAKSFRRAGEAIGMPIATVSRRINGLEQAIGLRLLHRTTRRIELTEAGQLYYERCRRIVEEARLAHQQLGELLEQPSGVLRVSLPVDFAAIFLAPSLGEFAQRYPGIRFELDLTPRKVDLVAEPFDLAIRMGDLPDSALIARKLADLPRYLYASPAYLERAGEPRRPHDLAQHECLPMLRQPPAWRLHKASDASDIVDAAINGRFHVNSIGMMRQLAIQGMGIALVAPEIVAADVAAGTLQRVLPGWRGPEVPVYAVTETRLLPAKTQRFIEFLIELLG
ncbi:LysR family transcriptional regulator [Pseudoduganella ginsengisoli]|uniref:LysR family transcriptional regulator n=1 Tax=Pseudoduganella ginsengisoli TaxID=1462440 RepID=A0A6L6Q7L3_9BURK|nr:LysR family transcriptional regulator [Pseudoduganella ginsengisoli]MTW05162.1 LysR family transcriptional regulator [Pseudoduganella ginsengisoli]